MTSRSSARVKQTCKIEKSIDKIEVKPYSPNPKTTYITITTGGLEKMGYLFDLITHSLLQGRFGTVYMNIIKLGPSYTFLLRKSLWGVQ